MTERTFSVLLQPEPEGGFTVLVPGLPEVVTYGTTEEEALTMAKEAIELALEVRGEKGDEVPAATEPRLRQVKIALAV